MADVNSEADGTEVNEEVVLSDQKKDLIWAMTTPLEEMTLEEQLEALQRIRELRKVKMTVKKGKSELDQILDQLTPERAAALLKQLEAMGAAATAEEEKK